MLKLFILSLLISSAFAQNCLDVKDGETIRLDDSGKSLHGFKAQDQDGMGTCYANTASVMLQSTLSGHPELSYIHIASLYNKATFDSQRIKADKDSYSNIYTDYKGRLSINGGDACFVINEIKMLQKKEKRPLLCQRKDVNIEKLLSGSDISSQQNRTLIGPSGYMNLFQKEFSGIYKPTSFWGNKERTEADNRYYSFARSFNDLIEKRRKQLTNYCKKARPYGLTDLFDPLKGYYSQYGFCLKSKSYDMQECEILKSLLVNPQLQDDNVISEGFNPELSKKLSKKLREAKRLVTKEDVMDMMADVLSSESAKGFFYLLNKSSHKNDIRSSLDKMPSHIYSLMAKEHNEFRTKGYSEQCIDRAMFNYITGPDFKSDARADENLCKFSHLTDMAPNVALSFKDTGLHDFKAVADFISYGARLNYDDVFLRYFALTCNQDNKIKIPENLDCNTHNIDPANKASTNDLILKNLRTGKAIGMSICSIVYNYKLNRHATPRASDCGPHAVTLIGVKCEKGQLKYLVQNSWGKEHSPMNEDMEKDLRNNGASWFNENAFFSGTYELETLEFGAK